MTITATLACGCKQHLEDVPRDDEGRLGYSRCDEHGYVRIITCHFSPDGKETT